MTKDPTVWLAIGFLGQAIFTARFVVQWVASEKCRNSVVPVTFWWLSLLGGSILLAYASYKRDPVILVGQSMGLFVYVRNLVLVRNAGRRSTSPELMVPLGVVGLIETATICERKAA